MDYTVKKSRTGLGLFASRPYKKGEFVIEYVGDIIDQEEANRRGGQYLFEVNKKITIDGSLRSNVARYINHACKGENCEVRIKKGRVFIHTIKPVLPGEEFSYDYGKEFWNEYIKPKGCKCLSCEKKALKKSSALVKKSSKK
jgi:SET domain-containing protein